jgi:hypothetical protein
MESNQGGASRNSVNQPERSPPVIRTDTSSSSSAPVSSLPLRLEDLTLEAPPGYTPNFTNPDPAVRLLSQQALTTHLTQLQTTLTTQNKGSISIRPYTAAGYVDAVKLVYIGMTQIELTARELGIPTYSHTSFRMLDFFSLVTHI